MAAALSLQNLFCSGSTSLSRRLTHSRLPRRNCSIAFSSLASVGVAQGAADDPPELQGTEEWFALRRDRMTASSFGTALGFWPGRRSEYWEEKVGLREPFGGNGATEWGVSSEKGAVDQYLKMTGNQVSHISFKIYREGDPAFSWLGASPDGLIPSDSLNLGTGPGVLEVKCPYNKGQPQSALPFSSVPFYYIPQAQGLMEILDRDWLDFYVWTASGGSHVYRLNRDPAYWALLYSVLSDTWWAHVAPGRRAVAAGEVQAALQFKPQEKHKLTDLAKSESQRLAREARRVWTEERGTGLGLRV